MTTHLSRSAARAIERLVQKNTVALLMKRRAEVEAEAAAFKESAEQQLAAYSAVINEHTRFINQLSVPEESA